jgi:hypothetical protein
MKHLELSDLKADVEKLGVAISVSTAIPGMRFVIWVEADSNQLEVRSAHLSMYQRLEPDDLRKRVLAWLDTL